MHVQFKVYIDQGVNQKKIKALARMYNFEVVQGHRTESRIKGASQISEPFTIGVSSIGGPDKLVGDEFSDITKIIGVNNKKDIVHLYSAHMEDNCRYFITNNPKDFIRSVRRDPNSTTRREELEAILAGLKIMTLDEFIAELKRKA